MSCNLPYEMDSSVFQRTLTHADVFGSSGRPGTGPEGQSASRFMALEHNNFHLLKRRLGEKIQEGSRVSKTQKLSKAKVLLVNIGSTATGGKVPTVKQDYTKIFANISVCTQEDH